MSNKFTHAIETAGKDVIKGITYPFTYAYKASKVLATVIKDQPVLKVLLTQMVQKAEQIAADGLAAGGAKGLNLAEDAVVLADAEAFFVWFKANVVPEIETVYGEIKTDVSAAVAPVSSAVTSVSK